MATVGGSQRGGTAVADGAIRGSDGLAVPRTSLFPQPDADARSATTQASQRQATVVNRDVDVTRSSTHSGSNLFPDAL